MHLVLHVPFLCGCPSPSRMVATIPFYVAPSLFMNNNEGWGIREYKSDQVHAMAMSDANMPTPCQCCAGSYPTHSHPQNNLTPQFAVVKIF